MCYNIALLPGFAIAQNKLTITGKVKGIKEGQLISLTDVNRPGRHAYQSKIHQRGICIKG